MEVITHADGFTERLPLLSVTSGFDPCVKFGGIRNDDDTPGKIAPLVSNTFEVLSQSDWFESGQETFGLLLYKVIGGGSGAAADECGVRVNYPIVGK